MGAATELCVLLGERNANDIEALTEKMNAVPDGSSDGTSQAGRRREHRSADTSERTRPDRHIAQIAAPDWCRQRIELVRCNLSLEEVEAMSSVRNLGERFREEARVLAAIVQVDISGLDDNTASAICARNFQASLKRAIEDVGTVPTLQAAPVARRSQQDNVGRIRIFPGHGGLAESQGSRGSFGFTTTPGHIGQVPSQI
jgi:hypothetical protein